MVGNRMEIKFLGVSSCIPDVGGEVASFLIDGRHLVDTGWCMALKLRQHGLDALALESIVLTHLHHDHILGLPGLLFHNGLLGRRAPLTIAGPREHLERVVRAAFDLLQVGRFPELALDTRLLPLAPGDSFALGDQRFETMAANHVSGKGGFEPALCYRVTQADGTTAVFTGDTHHHPPIAQFARGAALLIHDGAHTRRAMPPPSPRRQAWAVWS